MGLAFKTAPTAEPISLSEAKDYLGVEGTEQDTYVSAAITTARKHVEDLTAQQIMDATYTWTLRSEQVPQHHTKSLLLPRAPVTAVNSVEYVDTDGNTQSWSDYEVDLDVNPAVLSPQPDKNWPNVQNNKLKAFTVEFDAGYADTQTAALDAVPAPLRQAMFLLLGHWFDNRTSVAMDADPTEVPQTVRSLVSSYRVLWPV